MQDLGIGNVVAIATTLLGAATAAIVRLYRDRNAERRRADALQEQLHHEHKRDLRHVAGLPTSLQPNPPKPPKPPTFESTELFNIRDVRIQDGSDDDATPPSTERPPRRPPRPR